METGYNYFLGGDDMCSWAFVPGDNKCHLEFLLVFCTAFLGECYISTADLLFRYLCLCLKTKRPDSDFNRHQVHNTSGVKKR